MHEDAGEKEILTSLGKGVSEVLEQLYCTGSVYRIRLSS